MRRVPRGLAAWSAAIFCALVAQVLLGSRDRVPFGLALYAVAIGLLLKAAILIDRDAPRINNTIGRKSSWRRSLQPQPLRLFLACAFLGSGIVAVVAAVVNVAAHPTSELSVPLWTGSLTALTVGACLATTVPWRFSLKQVRYAELAGVTLIVGLAFALRFISVTGIPADVHGDEAAVGLEARRILQGQVPNLFSLGWASLPELSFVPSALGLLVFGDNLWGLRMASVIQGSLSVALLYFMAKRLFSVQVAALASFILATSQMAIHYSRVGNNYIGGLFVGLLLFLLLLRAFENGNPVDFLLAGFAAGWAVSVYYTARFALVVAALYLLQRAIGERGFLTQQRRGLAVLAIGVVLFLAPQLVSYAHDPASFLNRTSGVFVMRPDNMTHELEGYHVDTVGAMLWQQFIRSIGAFNLFGETSLQYGERAPLLDFWSGALFVLGMALATVRSRQTRYFAVASWFWVTLLLGSVLTIDALFSPRIVGMLGTLAVLTSLTLEPGWRATSCCFGLWGKGIATASILVFAALIGWVNYVGYFHAHVSSMEPEGFFTVLGRYAPSVNDEYRIYLLGDANTSLGYDTIRFLVPNVDGVEVRDMPLTLPLSVIPARKGVVFVDTERDSRFAQLRSQYPEGREDVHVNNVGYPEFYSYRVSHVELMTVNAHATLDNLGGL